MILINAGDLIEASDQMVRLFIKTRQTQKMMPGLC